MSNKFCSLLDGNNFIFLDGGMGTMLQSAGIVTEQVPELLNLSDPEAITNIHRMYVESGADIIYANTFGANRYKLRDSGHTVGEVIEKAIANARNAAVCGTVTWDTLTEIYSSLVFGLDKRPYQNPGYTISSNT